jgi:hypothetical protein
VLVRQQVRGSRLAHNPAQQLARHLRLDQPQEAGQARARVEAWQGFHA